MNRFHLRGIRPLCNSVTWAGILDDESSRRDVTDLIESLEFLSPYNTGRSSNFSRGKIVFRGIPCRQNIVRQVS